MKSFPDKMKRILVTGSEGFIGKALVKRLLEDGHEVTGFDLADGDIAERSSLDKLLGSGIEYVFHLAGRTFIPDSWEQPFDFYRVNVLGTLNVLEYCRKTGCELTYVSTYVYGTPEYLPIDEKHPVKANNPYTQSKIMAEELCRFYQKEFNVGTCILRPFNIYGPGQSVHFFIPEIILKILDPKLESITLQNIRPSRDFLFIDDFIDALINSVLISREIFNVGSGMSIGVKEIVNKIFNL